MAGIAVSPKMNAAESFFYPAVGDLSAYLGLWRGDPDIVRAVVGGMGVLHLSKAAVVAVVIVA